MLIRTLTRAAGRLNWQPGQVIEIEATDGRALIAAGAAVAVSAGRAPGVSQGGQEAGRAPGASQGVPEVTPGLTPAGAPDKTRRGKRTAPRG